MEISQQPATGFYTDWFPNITAGMQFLFWLKNGFIWVFAPLPLKAILKRYDSYFKTVEVILKEKRRRSRESQFTKPKQLTTLTYSAY